MVNHRCVRLVTGDMSSPFAFLDRPTGEPALVDAGAGRVWTQDELADVPDSFAEALDDGQTRAGLLPLRSRLASVVGYLSAVRAGHAVALLDAAAGADLRRR